MTQSAISFSVRVGWSELVFETSEQAYKYHYCFLIPANTLNQALEWMAQRVEIPEIEKGQKIQYYDDWNAASFYFYDASGNIVEYIARYDLNYQSEKDFTASTVLGVNEMGMPTTDISGKNRLLQEEIGTRFWKGDKQRFGTNGSQEGLFLLPNYRVKDLWFPTSIKIKPNPFRTVVENKGKEYLLSYKNEVLFTRNYTSQK